MNDVTRILAAIEPGDPTAADKLLPLVYRELRATAPAFAEQTRSLAAKKRFDEAFERLDYALQLRPE